MTKHVDCYFTPVSPWAVWVEQRDIGDDATAACDLNASQVPRPDG